MTGATLATGAASVAAAYSVAGAVLGLYVALMTRKLRRVRRGLADVEAQRRGGAE